MRDTPEDGPTEAGDAPNVERAGKVSQHFNLAQADIEQLQTSVNKITPRAEKLKELDFDK